MTPRERNQIHRKILTFKPKTFWIPFRCSFQALSHWTHSKGAAHKLPIPVAALWPQPNSNILSTARTQILVSKICDEVERGCRVHNLCQLQGHGSTHDILTSADIYVLPPPSLSAMYGYSLCEEQGKDTVSPMTFLHQRTCTFSIITVSHMWINLLRRANYLPAIKARTWFHPWCSYIRGHVYFLPPSPPPAMSGYSLCGEQTTPAGHTNMLKV